MKNYLNSLNWTIVTLDRQKIQLILLVISLSLLVLSAGAPVGGGDTIPGGGR
jgi:hypothetical protein